MCYVGTATKIFIFLVTVLAVAGLFFGFTFLTRRHKSDDAPLVSPAAPSSNPSFTYPIPTLTPPPLVSADNHGTPGVPDSSPPPPPIPALQPPPSVASFLPPPSVASTPSRSQPAPLQPPPPPPPVALFPPPPPPPLRVSSAAPPPALCPPSPVAETPGPGNDS